jgi:hypothetical protein
LEALPEEENGQLLEEAEEEPGENDVIEEREGVHYISKDILNPHPEVEKNLNQDFKNLVDSVINYE